MDISDTLTPKSDQIDAVELSDGPRTVTITKVTRGSAEQPVNIHVEEFDRPWRPAKGVRRLLAAAWGTDTQTWVGQRATIYLDTSVKYGGKEVGGVRVSALSGIDKPMTLPMVITRTVIQQVTIKPLPAETRQTITPEQVAACTSIDELRGMWQAASPDVQQLIQQRVAELQAQVTNLHAPEDDGGTAA